jgi:hypothetical protein
MYAMVQTRCCWHAKHFSAKTQELLHAQPAGWSEHQKGYLALLRGFDDSSC